MSQILAQIEELVKQFYEKLSRVATIDELEKLRIFYLGRNGQIVELLKEIRNFSPDDKKKYGAEFNQIKLAVEQAFQLKLTDLQNLKLKAAESAKSNFDVTAYLPQACIGSLHPTSLIVQKIENVFISMGYQIIEGPEVETDFYNFEALNVAPDHPARDMQDTFWLKLPGYLMRTQTSNVQIHTMQKQKPPIAMIACGRVYRSEATDASHDFVFRQCEGLFVDQNVSMSNLLATMRVCLQAIFEKDELEIRIRPGYFPFVEPGVEIDMQCPFCKAGCSVCKQTRWIELCGAGLVHPNVLRAVGIDPQSYSGFAFGFGLTRLVMLSYGITDIRLLHSNKQSFLNQF